MNTLVKICGLRTAEDVQAAVDAGADAVGFVFADSVRKVSPSIAAAISRSVPDTVTRVAVMLHPSNNLEVPAAIERWPVFREGGDLPATEGTYLYEGRKSGRGETVDWSIAARIARGGQMVLAGGLNVDNVGQAITTVRPFGVDVSSAVETTPGRKDVGLIRKFIKAARAAENGL